MSVSQSWLRDGNPATSVEDLANTLNIRYLQWEVVVAFPRKWVLNKRKNLVFAPVCFMLYGRRDSEEEESPHAVADAPITSSVGTGFPHITGIESHETTSSTVWSLLFYSVDMDCLNVREEVSSIVSDIFSEVPSGLHPVQGVTATCVTWGSTHQRINLLPPLTAAPCSSSSSAEPTTTLRDLVWKSIASVLPRAYASSFTIDAVLSMCFPVPAAERPAGLEESAVEKAVSWTLLIVGMTGLPAVTGDGSEGNAEEAQSFPQARSGAAVTEVVFPKIVTVENDGSATLLKSALHVNFLLRQKQYLPFSSQLLSLMEDGSPSSANKIDDTPSSSIPSSPSAHAGPRFYTTRKSFFVCFSIPENYCLDVARKEGTESSPFDVSQLYRHVLLAQDRNVEKRDVEFEELEIGPREPHAVTPHLHLFKEAGDAEFVVNQLIDPGALDVAYEDFMHSDGELQVQYTPLEGIPFDDIDAFVGEIRADSDEKGVSGCAAPPPTVPRSCCGWSFPRMSQCSPTGKVGKETIISGTHVILQHLPLNGNGTSSANDLQLSISIVLQFLSERVRPVWSSDLSGARTIDNASAFTLLPESIQPLDVDSACGACAWCGRRRKRLQRCSACKTVSYCCKQHQALDWKTAHKTDCGIIKSSNELYAQDVIPLLAKRGVVDSINPLPQTAWASCAATCCAFLTESRKWWLPRLRLRKGGSASNETHASGSSSGEQRPYVMLHIAGMNDFQKEFADALGMEYVKLLMCALTGTDNTGENDTSFANAALLKIVVCSEFLPEEENHRVYRIAIDGTVNIAPPTGVLGDVWHEKLGSAEAQSSPEDTRTVAYVRTMRRRYHTYVSSSIGRNDPPDALLVISGVSAPRHSGTNSECTSKTDEAAPGDLPSPNAPSDPIDSGMTYFSAIASVIADDFMGLIPIMCTDVSYIAAHRSWRSVVSRLANSTTAASRVKSTYTADAQAAKPPSLSMNSVGMCARNLRGESGSTTNSNSTSGAATDTPLHLNGYTFFIPPIESK